MCMFCNVFPDFRRKPTKIPKLLADAENAAY